MELTQSQKDAFKWLSDRGGDGVFAEKNKQVLLAQGERGPFRKVTWHGLVIAGECEFYGPENRRLRVKDTTQ